MLDAQVGDAAAGGLRRGEPVTVNGRPARYARTFADVERGELLLYEDGYRVLSLAVNRGSALSALGLRPRRRDPHRAGRAVSARLGRPRLHHRVTDSTSARRPGRWPPPERRTARSSPRASSAPAAAVRAGRGARRPGRALLMSLVLREWPRAAADRSPRSPSPTSPGRAARSRSSGPTTSCSTGASSPGSSPRDGRRRAGRCWGSGSTSPCARTTCRAELHDRAATLGLEPAAIEPTLEALLRALERRLAPAGRGDVLADYRARDALRGRARALGARRGRGARDRCERAAPRRSGPAVSGRRSTPARCICSRAA